MSRRSHALFMLFRVALALLASLAIVTACSTEPENSDAYFPDESWACSGTDYECRCWAGESSEGDCRVIGATECCRVFEADDRTMCLCESLFRNSCPRHLGGRWVDGCPPKRFVEPEFYWACYDDGDGCRCEANNVPQVDGACSQTGCCALLPVEASGGYLPGHRCICTAESAGECSLHYFAVPVAACPPPEPPQLPQNLVQDWYCGVGQECRCTTRPGYLTSPCPDKKACCRLSNDGQTCTCTPGEECPESGITQCPPP